MKFKFGVVADAATVSPDGKVNMLGVFENIMAPATPVVCPQMSLMLYGQASAGERGQSYTIEIKLIDDDGKIVQPLPAIPINIGLNAPGNTIVVPLTINLQGITFAAFGDYRFDILINGQQAIEVPIRVIPIKVHA